MKMRLLICGILVCVLMAMSVSAIYKEENLHAYWYLNDTNDYGPNGLDLTKTTNANFVTNGCLNLNGCVDIKGLEDTGLYRNSVSSILGNQTWSGWMKAPVYPTQYSIFMTTLRDDIDRTLEYMWTTINTSTNSFNVGAGDGDDYRRYCDDSGQKLHNALMDGNWHMYSWTFTKTGTTTGMFRHYVDGVLVCNKTYNQIYSVTQVLHIGSEYGNVNSFDAHVLYQNMGWWNVAFSTQDVVNLYNDEAPPAVPHTIYKWQNLHAYWYLNDTKDYGPNELDLTKTTNANFITSDCLNSNGCVDMKGTTNTGLYRNSVSSLLGNQSWSGWMKAPEYPTSYSIFMTTLRTSITRNLEYMWTVINTPTNSFDVGAGVATGPDQYRRYCDDSGNKLYDALMDGNWHMYSWTFRQTNTTAGVFEHYVDGVSVCTKTYNQIYSATQVLHIGSEYGNVNSFDAHVLYQNFGWWNVAFSDQDVVNLYHAELRPTGQIDCSNPTNDCRGLAGMWQMDEPSWSGVAEEVIDSHDGSLNGTAAGGATTVPNGAFNRAGSFDGVNDYVNIPGSADVGKGWANVTVSAWTNLGAMDSGRDILAKNVYTGENNALFQLAVVNRSISTSPYKKFEFWIHTVSNEHASISSSTVAQLGQWYYVVGTYDGSTMKIYVNGVLENQTSISGVLETGQTQYNMDIGSKYQYGTSRSYFNGTIDEVSLWGNRALTADEVNQLYTDGYITKINNAPVALDDAYVTQENTAVYIDAPGILANDSDSDDDALSAVLDTDVSSGTLTLVEDGSFLYDPNENFYGIETFDYVASDGTDNSNVATVTINVTEVPDVVCSVNLSDDSKKLHKADICEETKESKKYEHFKAKFKHAVLDENTLYGGGWLKFVLKGDSGQIWCVYVKHQDGDDKTHVILSQTSATSNYCDGSNMYETTFSDIAYNYNQGKKFESMDDESGKGLKIDTDAGVIDVRFPLGLIGTSIVSASSQTGEFYSSMATSEFEGQVFPGYKDPQYGEGGNGVPEFSSAGIVLAVVLIALFMFVMRKK